MLPSENENFGIAVAEAMLAGCYVITTQQVAASEHLQAARGGTVLSVPDANLLAKALDDRLRGDRARSRGAADYARSRLTWDALARTIIEQALSKRSRRA